MGKLNRTPTSPRGTNGKKQSGASTRRPRLLAGVALLAILLVILGLWFNGAAGDAWRWFWSIDAASLRTAIQNLGPWAPLASLGLMVIHAFVPFPLEFLAIANGLVFGTWGGIAITWFSMVISAWTGYAAARFAGPVVFRIVPGDRLERMEKWTRRRSDWQLVAVRFIPVISFSVLNLAAGLLGIRFWRFTWTTAVGIIPIVVVSVLTGNLLTLGPWGWAALGLVVLAYGSWEFWRRRK
ncbi:MAG: TVP38/TMEM64 family protein [Rubrobacteraceae bacterium]